MIRRLIGAVLVLLLAGSTVEAGPQWFNLPLDVPPIVADSTAPTACTVTYMIADLTNDDLYASRMRIARTESDTPVHNRLPCPPNMPPRVGLRALDVCVSRSGESKYCVFADMSRGFEQEPDIHNTAENASRCASDQATDIAVACWKAGKISVCNVACGNSPAEALAQSRARCEDKQQHSCPITATVPVSGP